MRELWRNARDSHLKEIENTTGRKRDRGEFIDSRRISVGDNT